jgi:hypothetical protein
VTQAVCLSETQSTQQCTPCVNFRPDECCFVSIQARIAVAAGSQSQGTDKGFVRFRSLEVYQDSGHCVRRSVPVERLAGIHYSGRLLSPND